MKKQRSRWWVLAVVLLVVLTILISLLVWDRFAPKAVLTGALSEAFSQLESRFFGSPLMLLTDVYDAEGKYTVDVALTDERDLLGTVTYDMTVQTSGIDHQLSATGTAATQGTTLDLSIYLDQDFIAVSSTSLSDGVYYGIAYDSFPEDLRKIPLLQLVISDDLINQWDSSLQRIQEHMSRNYLLPDISRKDYQSLLLGVAALPCTREKSTVNLDGATLTCDKLDIITTAEQLGQLPSVIAEKGFSQEAAITASFYLYENSLIKASVSLEEGSAMTQFSLNLGTNPLEDPISLQSIQRANDQEETLFVQVNTQREENRYAETWDVKKGSEDHSFAYEWNPKTGEMLLRSGNVSETVSLNLMETDEGLELTTDSLSKLLQAMSQEETAWDRASTLGGCAMTIKAGSQITTPGYKKLDQWAMEDFITLLSGIGSLFGIGIA